MTEPTCEATPQLPVVAMTPSTTAIHTAPPSDFISSTLRLASVSGSAVCAAIASCDAAVEDAFVNAAMNCRSSLRGSVRGSE
jgi:hypothetical protein